MSIATLKKKSKTQYNNISVNQTGFSINGTHRSQGWIGHDNMTSHFFDTLSLENTTIIKPSVVSTVGMISTKYRWINRPYPHIIVKPDTNQNNNSQSSYLTYLQKKAIQTKKDCDLQNNVADMYTYKMGALDQSQYLINLSVNCNKAVYGPNENINKQPLPN